MSNLSTADLDAFRAEARSWLAENFPPSLKGRNDAGSEAPVV